MEREPARPWYLSATPLATLPWLIRLRWSTVLLDVVVLLVSLALAHTDFPLKRIAGLIALSGLANVAVAIYLTRGQSVPRAFLLLVLLVDVVLLTELLELTGGPFNPFAVIYVVHVALAIVTVGRPGAVLVALGAMGCYGMLLYWHTREGITGHHRINDFPTHLYTMWIAMGALAELVAYLVVQASEALDAMRARAARSERLVSLTTLAAGAAHELSTPLGTIALVARELEHATARNVPSSALATDARLIRTEVDRCQTILDQMSGRAGGSAADAAELVNVNDMMTEIIGSLPPASASRVQLHRAAALPSVGVSKAGLRQALQSLLNNAIVASPDPSPVVISAEHLKSPGIIRLTICDRGHGMPPDVLARAGEPFFSTREAGRGLGLGLFLARVFAERHGGSLAIESINGTTVTLVLPIASEE